MEKNWKEIALSPGKYNQEARIQAAFHLENDPSDEAINILGKGLQTDPSPIVRHEFAFALGETSHPNLAEPFLKEAVEKDKNVFVRHEAILALATLGRKENIPFIKQFLQDEQPEMAESAEIALQRLEVGPHRYPS